MKSNRDKSFNQKKIAEQRIEKLFSEAESAFKEQPALSHRYVALANRLSTRYKVKFTSDQKKLFCKACKSYLKNGVNSRIRIVDRTIVQTCLVCNNVRRTVFKKTVSKSTSSIKNNL